MINFIRHAGRIFYNTFTNIDYITIGKIGNIILYSNITNFNLKSPGNHFIKNNYRGNPFPAG